MAFITAPLPLSRTSLRQPLNSARPRIATLPFRPAPVCAPLASRRSSTVMAERTFIAVKPDGMNRHLLGQVISRFENKGFKLVGIKTLIPTRDLAETHYDALREKGFFSDLVDFITSGPVCAMVWEGNGVVASARTLIGETNPLTSPPGTIRGDFGLDIGRKYVIVPVISLRPPSHFVEQPRRAISSTN